MAKKKKKPRSAQQANRHERLKMLIAQAGSHAKLAELCRFREVQYISQMWTLFRGISDASAKKLEDGMGKPRGWMDLPVDEVRDGPAVAAQIFDPPDADILKQLLALDDPMQSAIRAVITAAYQEAGFVVTSPPKEVIA